VLSALCSWDDAELPCAPRPRRRSLASRRPTSGPCTAIRQAWIRRQQKTCRRLISPMGFVATQARRLKCQDDHMAVSIASPLRGRLVTLAGVRSHRRAPSRERRAFPSSRPSSSSDRRGRDPAGPAPTAPRCRSASRRRAGGSSRPPRRAARSGRRRERDIGRGGVPVPGDRGVEELRECDGDPVERAPSRTARRRRWPRSTAKPDYRIRQRSHRRGDVDEARRL